MMTTAAVIGLSAGKRLLSSSFYHSDLTEKFQCVNDHGSTYHQASSIKNVIVAKKLSNYGPNYAPSGRKTNPIKALKEHVDTASPSAAVQSRFPKSDELEEESTTLDHSVEALLLLQKSMLEKQWNLSFQRDLLIDHSERDNMHTEIPVTCSGVSARQRRMIAKRKLLNKNVATNPRMQISPELLQNRPKGYVRGVVSKDLLPHAEVVRLSKKIKVGLALDEHRSRLKVRLGCDPSEDQLATSLKISRGELHSKLLECSLAREKLVMSNVRLVMSIAQRYENMGVEMADLVQGGLIGLLRGIEKFDSSKGFRISTYVYWWIRQGVSRTLIENCRTLRLPVYMHERLAAIRKAKAQLEQRGLTPSINRIAQHLNISQRKVKNATEVISKVFSLDREAFPSLNGLPGATHHSYIADNRPEYIPWNGVHEWMLKDEVNRLIDMTLGEREREIIRLYHGLEGECLTWEEISKRIGLSRERVRQVGLVSMEKLKHAARNKKMEALLLQY